MDTIRIKKAQHETVGFVLIILIVVIIGVIFLGISLRGNRGVVTIDAEISNFLSASLDYTTECYKDHEGDYRRLEDVISYCYQKSNALNCQNSTNPCQYMNKIYPLLLGKFKPAGLVNSYKLIFYYEPSQDTDADQEESTARFSPFLTMDLGNSTSCVSRRSGESRISQDNGQIIVNLEVCTNI